MRCHTIRTTTRYISVDLRRTKTPRLWNDGYYSDEYPTTEEEDEEVMVDW